MSEGKPYEYFDTPDGYDVDKKLICLLKPTTLVALTVGFGEVITFSKPKGYLQGIGRVAYISSPFFASSLSFLVVTNGLASLRKKDDKLNWFLGGFSVGPVWGAFTRNRAVGFNLGLFVGALCFLKKLAVEKGYVLYNPNIKLYHSNIVASDYTLTKHIPGNWTTGKE